MFIVFFVVWRIVLFFFSHCSNHTRLQCVQLPSWQLTLPWIRGGPLMLQEDCATPQALWWWSNLFTSLKNLLHCALTCRKLNCHWQFNWWNCVQLQGLRLSHRSSRRLSTLLTGVEDSIMFLSSLLMDRFSPWNEEHFCKVTLTHSLVEFIQSCNKKNCGKIQVTRSVDTSDNDLSPQERRTVDSIVMARYTQTAKFQINFRLAKTSIKFT